MRRLRAALLRLAAVLGLGRRNSDISEELRSHMEMLAEEHRRRGLSDAEARRAAAAEFGSMTAASEAYRDRRGLPSLEQLLRDCRYAVRSLAQTRVLTVSMLLVLALGVGVTTTLATMVHTIAFRPLSVPASDRLVKISQQIHGDVDRRVNGHVSQFSYPELQLYQATTQSLWGVAGVRQESASWLRDGQRRSIRIALVTPNYFSILQVRIASGRLIGDGDRQLPVAVISHRLWMDAFAQDPTVVGRSIMIDRVAYTVVGIAEPGFSGTDVDRVDAWLPIEFAAPARGHALRMTDSAMSWLQVLGRLAPGATVATASAEAGVIAGLYDAMHPGQRTAIVVTPATHLDAAFAGDEAGVFIGVTVVVALLGLSVLLICTSNAAALLLARGAARQREFALRLALGASRGRVIRQLLFESLLIAVGAAFVGLVSSAALLRAVADSLPMADYFRGFTPDGRVIFFAVISALGAALLFGVVPAIYTTRVDPLPVLKDATTGFGIRLPASRVRHWLVAGQVAASMVLLAMSALLGRGLVRALHTDSGFPTANLYAIVPELPAGDAAAADRSNVIQRLSLALQSKPGWRVSRTAIGPFGGRGVTTARAAGMATPVQVFFNKIGEEYFRTLGVTPVTGRDLHGGDDRTNIIVNARLARQFWGNETAAIGQTLVIPDDRESYPGRTHLVESEAQAEVRTATVVGVIPTLHSTDVGVADGPTFYVPLTDANAGVTSFLVRSDARPALQQLVDGIVQGAGASASVVSIDEQMAARTTPVRAAALATLLVGLLTLFIAGAGIYGIVAHAVVARTHEIGVHVALGATRARVARLVLHSILRAIGVGVAVGAIGLLVVTLTASHAIEPMLFGLRTLDPLAVLGAVAFLALVTGVAAYLPVRRALAVTPMTALRRF